MVDKENSKMMMGMVKAAEVYGSVCSAKNCRECSVGIVRGDGMTCAEFAKQFPKKFVSLLLDEYQDGVSYAEEYCSRFPYSELTTDDIVALGMCRKSVFAGDISCERASDENCKACWNERYISDVEYEAETEEEDSGITFQYGEE